MCYIVDSLPFISLRKYPSYHNRWSWLEKFWKNLKYKSPMIKLPWSIFTSLKQNLTEGIFKHFQLKFFRHTTAWGISVPFLGVKFQNFSHNGYFQFCCAPAWGSVLPSIQWKYWNPVYSYYEICIYVRKSLLAWAISTSVHIYWRRTVSQAPTVTQLDSQSVNKEKSLSILEKTKTFLSYSISAPSSCRSHHKCRWIWRTGHWARTILPALPATCPRAPGEPPLSVSHPKGLDAFLMKY